MGLGRGYIGEWWGAGAALSEAVPPDDDYFVPARFLGLFAGGASAGDYVQTDNPSRWFRSTLSRRDFPTSSRAGEEPNSSSGRLNPLIRLLQPSDL